MQRLHNTYPKLWKLPFCFNHIFFWKFHSCIICFQFFLKILLNLTAQVLLNPTVWVFFFCLKRNFVWKPVKTPNFAADFVWAYRPRFLVLINPTADFVCFQMILIFFDKSHSLFCCPHEIKIFLSDEC